MFPLKPFWRDEWCMLHNLKFKTPAELWGPLDFTQQFPRVYLQLMKAITSAFDYSYPSLRVPSFAVGTAALLLAWHLGRRIFGEQPGRYLFALVVAGNPMFIDYYGQVKHYEMEMLMSLVALWQYLELLKPAQTQPASRFAVLLFTLALAPFFSYTYPIAIAPAYILLRLQMMNQKRLDPRVAAALAVSLTALFAFYFLDVRQLLQDANMHAFWHHHADYWQAGPLRKATNIFRLFAKTGAGIVFEIVFGIAGTLSFVFSLARLLRNDSVGTPTQKNAVSYALLLVMLVIVLFLAGKIPLGQAKFSAFAAPALGIVLAFTLDRLANMSKTHRLAAGIRGLLFLALAGNILTAFLQVFTSPDYKTKLRIYHATDKALHIARSNGLPILVSPRIGLPDDITEPVTYLTMPDAAGILRTYPAWHQSDSVHVVAIGKNDDAPGNIQRMLPGIKQAMVIDGEQYQVITIR